jgi:hypothetical protein
MLNNLINIFNLIKTKMVKTIVEADDLIILGTRDSKYTGNYKPTVIKFADMATQLNAGEVESVTDDGNGVVSVDNTDTTNPVIKFNGVNVDGISITGNGTSGNPLVAAPIPTSLNFGLFSQTADGGPVTATVVETTIIGPGVGTLTVPANAFQIGDSFQASLDGIMSCVGSATIQIRVKTLTGLLLTDTGIIDLESTTSKSWLLTLYFTIRTLGGAGTASISSGGLFSYIKNSGANFEGYVLTNVNSTTFDTTIDNTLDVTIEWNTNNGGNSILSRNFTLTKIY